MIDIAEQSKKEACFSFLSHPEETYFEVLKLWQVQHAEEITYHRIVVNTVLNVMQLVKKCFDFWFDSIRSPMSIHFKAV